MTVRNGIVVLDSRLPSFFGTLLMVYFARATLRFDGACSPNPGYGGCGWRIFNDKNGNTILEGRCYLGSDCTNNIAEYQGLIHALKHLRSSAHRIGHLDIEGDSEIVIYQLRGTYNVYNQRLKNLNNTVHQQLAAYQGREFESYSFRHIDRETNWAADGHAKDSLGGDDWEWDYY